MKYNGILILIIISFIGCKRSSPERTEKEKLNEKIDTYLKEAVERLDLTGLTVAVTRNDSTIYSAAFGVRNVDTQEPMKPEHIFHWASVSKTFVAMAILQLAEQGKINLDEKLVTYLPYFKQDDENYKMVTIRQMLNHTSGIGDVEDYEWDKPQYDEGAAERYVRSLAHDKMVFAPGKDWQYSNTAFDIFADVIAKVSGMSFETYIKKNIFEPLEMTHTSFIYPEIPESLRVTPHTWSARPITSEIYPYNRRHAPSSCLNSSVLEMTHYAIANLHRGKYKETRILSDSSYNLLWTNSVNLEKKPKLGLSWFLGEYKGFKTVYHSGGDTGFRSLLFLCPENNLSIMLVSNNEMIPTRDFVYGLFDILVGNNPAIIKQLIGIPFARILKEEGLQKAKDFLVNTKDDSTKQNYFSWEESSFTYPAYMLLEQGSEEETLGLTLMKYNSILNPSSSNAYARLGDAYAWLGRMDSAKIYLRRSIQIDSTNTYAVRTLKAIADKSYKTKLSQ